MVPPKIEPKLIPRAELERLFNTGGWAARLKLCRTITHWDKGGSTVLYEYWHSDEGYIALVCYHRRADKSLGEPHPKMLLIDGLWHAC